MNKPLERLYNGLIRENPTVVLMLGMCPTLAITTSAINGIGMGLSTTAVLAMSNLIISALRKIIPDSVRMPAYIVIVASLVTIIQFLIEGYLPSLNKALGIYIPLIVVNCIILGRAEAYASKNPVIPSLFDGIGMGLGFTMSITTIGIIRELIAAGSIFGVQILPLADAAAGTKGYTPVMIFGQAPGAFLILALLVAVMKEVRRKMAEKGKPLPPAAGCVMTGSCSACTLNDSCFGRLNTTEPELSDVKKAAVEKAVKHITIEKEASKKGGEDK